MRQEVIKKTSENDLCQKLTRLAYKKKCQSPLCPGSLKRWEEKVCDVPRNPCWVQQWFRSIWREAPVCICRITGIEFYSFPMRNLSPLILVQQIEWSYSWQPQPQLPDTQKPQLQPQRRLWKKLKITHTPTTAVVKIWPLDPSLAYSNLHSVRM